MLNYLPALTGDGHGPPLPIPTIDPECCAEARAEKALHRVTAPNTLTSPADEPDSHRRTPLMSLLKGIQHIGNQEEQWLLRKWSVAVMPCALALT